MIAETRLATLLALAIMLVMHILSSMWKKILCFSLASRRTWNPYREKNESNKKTLECTARTISHAKQNNLARLRRWNLHWWSTIWAAIWRELWAHCVMPFFCNLIVWCRNGWSIRLFWLRSNKGERNTNMEE